MSFMQLPVSNGESTGASNVGSSSNVLIDPPSVQVDEAQKLVKFAEGSAHELTCGNGAIPSETERVLQTDSYKSGEEAMLSHADIESLHDVFLQSSGTTEVKKVGKFQPKPCSRPKEQKAKPVAFSLPDETVVAPSEFVSQPKQKKPKSVSFSLPVTAETAASPDKACIDIQPSFGRVINDADELLHSTPTISDNVGFRFEHESDGNEELADLSGLDSFDSILSGSTSDGGKARQEFPLKHEANVKTVKPSTSCNANGAEDSASSQWDALPVDIEPLEDLNLCAANLASGREDPIEMSSFDTGSPGDNMVFETIDTTMDGDNAIGAEANLAAISEVMANETQTQEDDGQTQEMLDNHSKSKNDDASKSSRKLGKRTAMHSSSCQLDGVVSESFNAESPDYFQIDEYHTDDEYQGEDVPNQKRQPKRSKRQTTDADKQIKRRRKPSKEPDSRNGEPPKKRFPHGTRRKRRQVDKALLERSEYELDKTYLRHIAIKQLILLGEANERISNKEGGASKNIQSNSSCFPGGTYVDEDNLHGDNPDPHGEESHLETQRSSNKLNYMTHMVKPQRGRWSKSETELFYEAIRQFGTDFGMIMQLFPNKTREQVKSKFKLEERKHPLEIHDAMSHRSGDHSHFEKVIKLLQAKAEEESRHDDENGDPTTVSQDAANGNEEQRDEPGKEEEAAADGFDSVSVDLEEPDEWNAVGIADYNEYESIEWDADGSFPQDDKYSEFDEIF